MPTVVNSAIESVQSSVSGHSISQMLLEVSTAINHALSNGGRQDVDTESSGCSAAADEDDHLLDDDSDAEMWSNPSPTREDEASAKDTDIKQTSNKIAKCRIRSDLCLAREAGFKIGILGDLNTGGIVCVSIRVAKLGISEEAMNAWRLRRNQYLILLIRYRNGYKSIEDVKEETMSATSKTEFRVALCQRYKPSITEAVNAFSLLSVQSHEPYAASDGRTSSKDAGHEALGTLEPLFIGRPLNDLLKRLPAIVKYRISCSFSWTGAELFFNEIQAKAVNSIDPSQRTFAVGDDPASRALPQVVTADHLGEPLLPRSMSFPLAAMQFLLRHFVRCTEFCLVCHCRTDASFEALKPYVCSKPLCLFQYMALGFGPSIEWEILTQPYVVDLLVSFCYASAQGHRLKDFPLGIDLKVPALPRAYLPANYPQYGRMAIPIYATAPSTPTAPIIPRPIASKFDAKARELILIDQKAPGPLRTGDWVVVTSKFDDGEYHARVEANFCPSILLGELIYVSRTDQKPSDIELPKPAAAVGLVDAEVFLYDQSFDELPDQEKPSYITFLLDTLPDVMQMKAFLESNPKDPSLKRFRDRISKNALDLLRWVIASNRSCIMQVDRTSSSPSFPGAEDRVSGMAKWMQFRFAQGAPDKEQRFTDCVKEVANRLQLKDYPTLFAWHGSPLANWHSIVREGLHFNDTLHGRAYGHGVYMSPEASTSIGYSGAGSYTSVNGVGTSSTNWRSSKLCISSALALNEVVNAPAEYVKQSPHYVVNKLDWIQTRYLFVKANHDELGHNLDDSRTPGCVYEQDPKHPALDERRQPIVIPISAISKSRRPVVAISPLTQGAKKAKVIGPTSQEHAEKTEDDAASMVTDSSDMEFLLSDGEEEAMVEASHCPQEAVIVTASRDETPQTYFVSGQLDTSTLPLLAPPSNASTGATKALQTTLKQTLLIQNTTPLHELGWYINEDLISNIYQWIVELHSFDPSLPLAQDMVHEGIQSIVLEIRFSNNFPISPPFVRVIRPRFLPFMQGGGGHVTSGGALCMELLTNSGWSPASSVESVLLQVRMAVSSLEPKPARLMSTGARRLGKGKSAKGGQDGHERASGGGGYTVGEAVEAYKRACAIHGWQVPKEFDDFLKG